MRNKVDYFLSNDKYIYKPDRGRALITSIPQTQGINHIYCKIKIK